VPLGARRLDGTIAQIRVVVIWSNLPYYAFACLRALRRSTGIELRVLTLGDARPDVFQADDSEFPITVVPDELSMKLLVKLECELRNFKPDVLVVSGWGRVSINLVVALRRLSDLVCVCMSDTRWNGTLRQIARASLGSSVLRVLFDAIWVAGQRGASLAEIAGFSQERLWRGFLAADPSVFGAMTSSRLNDLERAGNWPPRFIFVGRLSAEKGISILRDAYTRYRRRVALPWSLVVVGDGPERRLLEGLPDVTLLGWCDHRAIAKELVASGALILPSVNEAWGVVVHEAALSGLPLICSTEVGATADLLHSGLNGKLFLSGNVDNLADAMSWITEHPQPWKLGQYSFALSKNFSPELWAHELIAGYQRLCAGAGMAGIR